MPAGRMGHEPASSTVVVSSRPMWGDVSIWVDPGKVEEAMGGANLRGYVVSTPAQAQDAERQGHWFLDPRHLPMNTSQEIEKVGGRPGAHEEAAEPSAEPAAEPSAEPSAEPAAPAAGPITIPVSLPEPKDSNPCAEIVAWFEHSVVVGRVAFSPMKDSCWTVEAIAAAGWPVGGNAISWVVCVWRMWPSRAILNWLRTHTQR